MSSLSQHYLERFGGIARLYGLEALERLAAAKVAVIGLGGVGSWAAEALVRSGVGQVTLIELDDVCITNTNRQLHAKQSAVGRPKIDVVAERLRDINPEVEIECIADFLSRNNVANLLGSRHTAVLDAMDSAHIKAALVAYCSAVKVRLVVCGSSGGKRDPSRVQVADLGFTTGDPMLAKVRTQLYRHYNFARDPGRKFRVDAVFSAEQMVYPQADGTVCMSKRQAPSSVKLDCSSGFGASVMVTGSFGFLAAARVVERIIARSASRA